MGPEPVRVATPWSEELARSLRAGTRLLLSGPVLVARDAAHRRMVETIGKGGRLPFEISGQVIYYAGPTPARPGKPVGSMGPTTSGRMDPYVEPLLALGLRGMIGKGRRGPKVMEALAKYGAVYLAATGGAGALLAERIKSSELLAWPELGPEAVLRIELDGFPVLVAGDAVGGDLYEQGQALWRSP